MSLYDPVSPILTHVSDIDKFIILFDPSPVYARIRINTSARRQSLSMGTCFPNIEKGLCACGCGKKLPKYATRWANPDHADALVYVMKVIAGDTGVIRRLLSCYKPLECELCKKPDYEIVKYDVSARGHKYISYAASGIHVDHIVSVKNGGGGCWLGNYRFLCHTCNIQKERTDRLLRNIPAAMPISNLFNY